MPLVLQIEMRFSSMIELDCSYLTFQIFLTNYLMFELMSFGSIWTTCINCEAKEIRFPYNIISVWFCIQCCKTYFGSSLVHDILPCLDRLFQVIELIDDVLALLNLVSLVRHAGCLTSKYRSLFLKSVSAYPKVSNLNSITLPDFQVRKIQRAWIPPCQSGWLITNLFITCTHVLL